MDEMNKDDYEKLVMNDEMRYTKWKKSFLDKHGKKLDSFCARDLFEALKDEDCCIEYKDKIILAHSKKQHEYHKSLQSATIHIPLDEKEKEKVVVVTKPNKCAHCGYEVKENEIERLYKVIEMTLLLNISNSLLNKT